MANARYRRRGNQNLWAYEIREEGKTVAYNSGFKTKKLAEAEAEPILQKLRTGSIITKDISLPELYQEWLDLKIIPSNRSDVTKKKYLRRKVTLEKLFGDKPISQIRPSEYQRIMNNYGNRVSRNFLGRLNTGVKQSLQMAIADKVMIEDFTQIVELFSTAKSQDADSKYLHSEKDYLDLISAIKGKFDYKKSVVPYIIYFLLKTGMRYGELIALTWEDIDFDKKLLHIRRTISRIKNLDYSGESDDEPKTVLMIGPPKSVSSIRDIPIPDFLLKKMKRIAAEPDSYLLTGTNRKCMEPRNIQRKFQKLLQQCEIPSINIHSLRHAFATRCTEMGFDSKTLSEILGHSSVKITMDIYVHSSIKQKQKCMEKLNY